MIPKKGKNAETPESFRTPLYWKLTRRFLYEPLTRIKTENKRQFFKQKFTISKPPVERTTIKWFRNWCVWVRKLPAVRSSLFCPYMTEYIRISPSLWRRGHFDDSVTCFCFCATNLIDHDRLHRKVLKVPIISDIFVAVKTTLREPAAIGLLRVMHKSFFCSS